jgi:uncharacterized protein YndB with AHSA1/START domain
MARNECLIDAPAAEIFSVFADATTYDHWVVGAKDIRAVDPMWPQVGARFHHTFGIGPINLKDSTQVLEAEAPRHLVLEARGRPFGVARVEFRLEQAGSKTRVTMDEVVIRPEFLSLLNPLFAPLTRARNSETLRRLTRIITERRSSD